MKKQILNDNHSICSCCFQELDYDAVVYIDVDDDIICEDCKEEMQ